MDTLSRRMDGLWRHYERHFRCEVSFRNMKSKCEQHKQRCRMVISGSELRCTESDWTEADILSLHATRRSSDAGSD